MKIAMACDHGGLKNSAKYRDQINKITDYKEVIVMLEEYMQHSLTQIG